MLDFMVIALPRSATAWTANFLTTERSMCWHEPLISHDLADLDEMKMSGRFGIADTQLCLLGAEELNRHKARKLIIHREFEPVAASLTKLNLPLAHGVADALAQAAERLYDIEGWHLPYDGLFKAHTFQPAFEWLTNMQFDKARHAMLKDMNVQNTAAIKAVQELVEGLL